MSDIVERLRYNSAFKGDTYSEAADEITKLREERDNLLRGEYICKQCGLRKDSERSANHDF